MVEEGVEETGLGPDLAKGLFGLTGELILVFRGSVGQGVGFEVTPAVLHGIELRGVRGEVKKPEADGPLHKLPDLPTLVSPQAIPEDKDLSLKIGGQLSQKMNAPRGVDILIGMEAEVEPGAPPFRVHTQGSQGRDFLPGSPPLSQNRRLAAGSPGATDPGGHEQPCLVYKTERRPDLPGFFLMRGHWRLTHRRIAFSSRSIAFRCGF